jgi:Mg-chelatase subunit ChlD
MPGRPPVGGIEADAQVEASTVLGPELSDEEAEQALLSRFLFAPPKRQVVAGERNGLILDRVLKQIQALLRMLSGGKLRIAYSDPASTDNTNVYLPRALPAPEEPQDALLFQLMGLVQVGFIQAKILTERPILAEIHRDWVLRSCYHLLATRYVLRRWAEQFPGIASDLEKLPYLDKAGILRVNVTVVPREGLPGAFLPLYQGLTTNLNWKTPGAEGDPARAAVAAVDRFKGEGLSVFLIAQSRTLREHYRRLRLGPPPLPFFAGIIRPEWILADLARDIAYEQEWKKGQLPLRQLLEAMAKKGASVVSGAPPEAPRLSLKDRLLARLSGPDMSKAPAYGKLRDEHLESQKAKASEKPGFVPGMAAEELTGEQVERPEEDGFPYDEWDDGAGAYKFGATKVVELDAPTGSLEAYQKIVEANRRAIIEIRRRFEALKSEERWLHGQRDGAELDLNRVILAMADIRANQQPDDRIFKRFVRRRQPIAILTLVDVSGSTQGRVLYAEQEAIVLFAEGLKTLGLPHAFYGVCNTHPLSCQFQKIKGFDELYGDPVYKRLGNLRANGATRMGAFLRHACAILGARPAARRLLLILSDGKPEDRGEYRGSYGIKDTAMAVQEARRLNVHPFCISVDAAEDSDKYLEPIFGKSGYLKLSDVDMLPKRLPEVFRKMIK